MPVSVLDEKTALVVIDLQKGIVGARPERAEVVTKARALADVFRAKGLPVVLVNAIGGGPGRGRSDESVRAKARADAGEPSRRPARDPDSADIVPEMNPQPTDHLVSKRTWGAFTSTDLDDYLKGLGVTQIVFSGIATSAGVESSARQAHERGYNVTFATDAMIDGNPELHLNAVTRLFPKIGETGTTAEILALLEAEKTPVAAPETVAN